MSQHKTPDELPSPESNRNSVVDVWELSMALREAAMANPVKVFPPGISDEAPAAGGDPDPGDSTKKKSDSEANSEKTDSGSHPA